MQLFTPASIGSPIAALPKADLHVHQEAKVRLERLAAVRQHRPPYDWAAWSQYVLTETEPGFGRLADIYEPDAALDVAGLRDDDPEIFIERVAALLEEGAADEAVLIEVRFGADEVLSRPDFMALFREAERRVRERYPQLVAEALGWLNPAADPQRLEREERRLEACLRAAREGLAGVDFRVDPYETEADPELWTIAYAWAERATDAGLGVTVHAGEFSTANIEAALRMPALGRIGHAVYAASEPHLLEQLLHSGATVESSLTCNVILGAVPSYEAHPIRRFVEAGVPVALGTDLPVHTATTIGREYAIAAALGFSTADLLAFTRNAVRASFTSGERRMALLDKLRA